jgi:hypothetical protein
MPKSLVRHQPRLEERQDSHGFSNSLVILQILVALFTLLLCSTSAGTLSAQVIKIKLVNGKNGRPIAGACVNVWVGSERKVAMAIPTDENGVASVYLTDKAVSMNAQNSWKACGYFGVIDPVAKYEATIRINAGYVLCQPHRPDSSWLAMSDFSTDEILQRGIVSANTCGRATRSQKAGEVILFVRPLTWWEKLKQ